MIRRSFDVAGKVVLITGAARGIGAATARRLHRRGARVALVGLEPALLKALAAELGEGAAWFESDVSDPQALRRAITAAAKHFGGIDVVIANAGICELVPLAEASPRQVVRTLDVNLLGVWHTLHAALPYVIEREGYVLNVASMAALTHGPLMGAYAASKAAVEALTDSLRVEMSTRGVAVGCAYFAMIDTDLARTGLAHPAAAALADMMPSFLRTPASLDAAVDVIERGIRRRAARIWAPPWLGAFLLLRGVVQPLLEWNLCRDRRLAAAMDLGGPTPVSADASTKQSNLEART